MTPETSGLLDPSQWVTESGRLEVDLGINFDKTMSTLPAYVDIDGVQVHPSRVEDYLAQRQEWEKKG